MKKSIIFSFLAAMVLFACRKSDNPKIPELTRVPVPKLTVVANSDQAIDVANNPANFKGNFEVGLLFPEDVKPQKVDVVVRKNGTGTVKVFKTDVTAFPTSLQVTGQQLIDLFGPIALGDYFDFATDIYLSNGLKIEAFPTTGLQFSGGTANIPTSSTTLRYAAICKYDPTIYQGDFVVVSDDWADFSPGEVVVLTKVSNTSFSFIDPYAVAPASGPVPIVVNVNTGNNSVSITRTVIGTKWVWSNTYTGPAVATTGSSSLVAPCDKTVTLNMQYSVDQGTFGGAYPLVLRKK
jgi:hypothetical protein